MSAVKKPKSDHNKMSVYPQDSFFIDDQPSVSGCQQYYSQQNLSHELNTEDITETPAYLSATNTESTLICNKLCFFKLDVRILCCVMLLVITISLVAALFGKRQYWQPEGGKVKMEEDFKITTYIMKQLKHDCEIPNTKIYQMHKQ